MAIGSTPAEALELAAEVENLAAQYLDVLATGRVHVLDDEEMKRVLAAFSQVGR